MIDPVSHLGPFTDLAYPLGDGLGSICLMDVMGDDRAVAASARTSYGATDANYGEKEVRGLIRFLLSNRHTTPVESCEIKLWVKLPIFVERQWARHRTAHWNEMSARYMQLPKEYYIPNRKVRPMAQAQNNKQGSEGHLPEADEAAYIADLIEGSEKQYQRYQAAIDAGMALEIARLHQPVNMYTVKVWKVDLHNLLHFIGLRFDSHAQWEIQQYASFIADVTKAWVPHTWEAVEDYYLKAFRLSSMDLALVRTLIQDLLTGQSEGDLLSTVKLSPSWDRMTAREHKRFVQNILRDPSA